MDEADFDISGDSDVDSGGDARLDADAVSLLEANAAFYAAFEQRDITAMASLWASSEDVVVVHPGWAPLYGPGDVHASWARILLGPDRYQFVLSGLRFVIRGDVGLVWVTEGILNSEIGGADAALNVFVRDPIAPYGWRMLAHHAAWIAPEH